MTPCFCDLGMQGFLPAAKQPAPRSECRHSALTHLGRVPQLPGTMLIRAVHRPSIPNVPMALPAGVRAFQVRFLHAYKPASAGDAAHVCADTRGNRSQRLESEKSSLKWEHVPAGGRAALHSPTQRHLCPCLWGRRKAGQKESRAGAPSAGDGGLTCPIAQQGCSCGDETAAGLIHTPVSVVLLCHRSLHHYAWMGCPNPWGESKANLSALHSGLCNALCGGVAILCT